MSNDTIRLQLARLRSQLHLLRCARNEAEHQAEQLTIHLAELRGRLHQIRIAILEARIAAIEGRSAAVIAVLSEALQEDYAALTTNAARHTLNPN